jgi:hypothetical protein
MIRRWLLWWWTRRDSRAEFTFPGVLRQAKRILILMPSSPESSRQSEYFLSHVPRAFPKVDVTLLYPPKSMTARFYNPFGFHAVVPASSQVGWWGIPRKKFLLKLFEKPFDILITLDREPSVFLAAVMASSGTPVRLGLPNGMGVPYVTVELRHGREQADIKTEFILFIEMIRRLAAPTAAP